MPSENSSDQNVGPEKKRDYEKIKRNYAKMLEIGKMPHGRERIEAISKLLDEAEGKTPSSGVPPRPQSATSSDEPRIEDLFTDVTHEREGWGFIMPGPAKAHSGGDGGSFCVHCGADNPSYGRFCRRCGQLLVTEDTVADTGAACKEGKAQPSEPAGSDQRSRDVAIIESSDDPQKGILGWLFLFCFGTTILQPIAFLRDVSGRQPITFFVDIPLAAFSFYVGFRLWSVRPNALKVVKVYFLVRLALAALTLLLVVFAASTGMYPGAPEKKAEMATTDALNSLLPAILVWIWWTYFKRSRRVWATYGANL